jgi:hypothetical protein
MVIVYRSGSGYYDHDLMGCFFACMLVHPRKRVASLTYKATSDIQIDAGHQSTRPMTFEPSKVETSKFEAISCQNARIFLQQPAKHKAMTSNHQK